MLGQIQGRRLLALKGPNISAQGNALRDVPIHGFMLNKGFARQPSGDSDCPALSGRGILAL